MFGYVYFLKDTLTQTQYLQTQQKEKQNDGYQTLLVHGIWFYKHDYIGHE